MLNVPMPMPRLTKIPMTVRFVMTGLRLAVKEVRVTAALVPLSLRIFSALELGGLGGSDTVAEAQASTKPTKLNKNVEHQEKLQRNKESINLKSYDGMSPLFQHFCPRS